MPLVASQPPTDHGGAQPRLTVPLGRGLVPQNSIRHDIPHASPSFSHPASVNQSRMPLTHSDHLALRNEHIPLNDAHPMSTLSGTANQDHANAAQMYVSHIATADC